MTGQETASPADLAAVEKVLAEHYASPNPAHCKCGWKGDAWPRDWTGYGRRQELADAAVRQFNDLDTAAAERTAADE